MSPVEGFVFKSNMRYPSCSLNGDFKGLMGFLGCCTLSSYSPLLIVLQYLLPTTNSV